MFQTKEITYRYRWVILGVVWIAYLVVFLNRLSIGPLAPFLKEELGISSAQVGMVMSAAGIGFMVTMLPAGWFVDRVGARWAIMTGELIAGTSMLVMFFAPSYTSLLILMFATGLGCGFLSPSSVQAVVAWFPIRERATVIGFKQTAVSIGGMITAATLPAVALSLGWRYGFLFLGIMAIAIGITSFILYKEPPRPAGTDSTELATSPQPVTLLELIKSREIWLVGLSCFCLCWVEFAAIAHLVLYLTEMLLFPVVIAGGLLAMAEAAGAITRPGSGLLSDRVFNGNRKPVFILMAGTACAMCLLLALFGSHLSWAIYPVLFLLGMGGIGFGGIALTLMSELGGRYGAGKAVGISGTVAMAGTVLGPIAFGYIVDISGSYRLAWLSLTFLAAICVLLLLFVREEQRKI